MIVVIAPAAADHLQAARFAGHLRALAAMLRERGRDAPSVAAQSHLHPFGKMLSIEFQRALQINWLRWIIVHRPFSSDPAETDLIRRVLSFYRLHDRRDLVEEDRLKIPREMIEGQFRRALGGRKRYGNHMSRWLSDDVDLIVAWHLFCCRHTYWARMAEALACWLARRPDRRFLLGFDQAGWVENFATLLEMTAGALPSPPRWALAPGGYWRGVAYNLVMKFDVSAEYFKERSEALASDVTIDLLAESLIPAAFVEERNIILMRYCRDYLVEAAQGRRERLRVATLTLRCGAANAFHYEVALETLMRGDRVQGKLRQVDPLRYEWFEEGGA